MDEKALAAVLERQDGLIDIDDLRRVGATKSDVDRWCDTGTWSGFTDVST